MSDNTNEEGFVPGFRSFWKNSKRKAAYENVTFVQVEVESQGQSSKLKAEPKSKKSKVESKQPQRSESPVDESGRREQVYQAQKRHRRRKAEYASSLEAEIARLKHLDALMKAEAQQLTQENTTIKDHLDSEGLQGMLDDGYSHSTPATSVTEPGSVATTDRLAEQLASEAKIERCRELLMEDVKDYDIDESEDERTWTAVADMVLSESDSTAMP